MPPRWFMLVVVALLTVIALQLGAWDSIADAAWHAQHWFGSMGARTEEPARASGGIQWDDSDAVRALGALPPLPQASSASR